MYKEKTVKNEMTEGKKVAEKITNQNECADAVEL